ncbi:MAG: nitrilase-related carbon-nitrogen hydrolase [bacterium]
MAGKQTSAKQVVIGLILSAISGALLAVAQPPIEFAPAAWVALVPLFIALMKFAPNKIAFGSYYATAIAVMLFGLIREVPEGFGVLYAMPFVMFIVAFLIFFWQKNLLTKNNYRWFTAINAAGLVGTEYLRQFAPTALFGALGISQYRHPEFIQIASLFGVFGVSLMIILVNCAVALLLTNANSIGKVRIQVFGAVLIVAILLGMNFTLLREELPTEGSIKAAAVQFGYVPELKTHPGYEKYDKLTKEKDWPGVSMTAIDMLEPLTRQAAQAGAQLIVWPEVMLAVDPLKYPDIAARLSALAVRTKAYLVIPYESIFKGQEKFERPGYTNELAVIAPDGKFIYRYLKQRMVKSFEIEKGREGHTTKVLDTAVGKLGLMICYDADFPRIPSKYAALGANVLVLPSHDLSQFITWHHPALLMFRSVENRRSVVKADFVQGAMILDPKGHILADPPDGLRIVEADIPLVSVQTPFAKSSVIFGVGSVIALILFLIIAGIQKDKSGIGL